MEKNEDKAFHKSLYTVFIVAFFQIALILGCYYVYFKGSISNDHTRWAEFGSFIGGTITPTVSLFALLALLITIKIQNETLRVSQRELSLTRSELAKTSASAESQAHHFKTEALINDVVQSIKQIEQTIETLSGKSIPVYDLESDKPALANLNTFLDCNMHRIRKYGPTDPSHIRTVDTRPDEIGKVFELLFQQLMLLKEIPEARHRYRVLMHKHLQTIFLLAHVKALPFDWLAPLDEESREWVEIYERTLKIAVQSSPLIKPE